jgi:hypothetical protein
VSSSEREKKRSDKSCTCLDGPKSQTVAKMNLGSRQGLLLLGQLSKRDHTYSFADQSLASFAEKLWLKLLFADLL